MACRVSKNFGSMAAIFSCYCGVSYFGGEKGERKEGGKFVLMSLHQYYHKDAKYLHHSSLKASFNLIKHNQPPTRLSLWERVEKAVAVRF
jgi:hypothetical protein